MVNVFGLSVLLRKEEIHYPSPLLPTTTITIIATTTIMDIFGLSFYCKEKPQENRNKKQKGEKTQKNQKQKEEQENKLSR
jgi:hypothetical protein